MDYGTAGGKFKMPQKAGTGGKVQWLATKAGFSLAAGSKMPGNKHRAAFPVGPGKKEIKK